MEVAIHPILKQTAVRDVPRGAGANIFAAGIELPVSISPINGETINFTYPVEDTHMTVIVNEI